jgi:hypothetical protein
MKVEWSSNQGLSKVVIAQEYMYHTRLRIGQFPQNTLVYDKPGVTEAFYHYDFQYHVNKLRWVAPNDNGAKPILGYKIYRDLGPNTPIDQLRAELDANTFEYQEGGLVTAWPYYYRILAINGDDGEPLTISAQPTVAPLKPEPALLLGTGTGALTFRITPYTGAASGFSAVSRYTLYRNDGLGGVLRFNYDGDIFPGDTGTNPSQLTVGGLVEGRTYVFQTTLWTRVAQSPMSNAVSILCCVFRPPGSAPQNLRRYGAQSDTRITIAWDAVTDIGSSSLAYYKVYLDDGNTEVSKNTLTGTQTYEFYEYLTQGGVYRFSVVAVNAAGEGPRSDRLTLVASDVAGMPQNVQVPLQSRSQIQLTWERPLLTGAAGINGYKVYANDGMGGAITNLIYDGSTRASTLVYTWEPRFSDGTVALLAGHSYRFQVQAVNPTGDGTKSLEVTGLAASKPLAPNKPTSDTTQTNNGRIVITWNAPDNGGSAIAGYIVERFNNGGWTQLTTTNTQHQQTTYTDQAGLQSNFVYTYRVSAFNAITTGDTQYSPEAAIACASVPTAPTLAFVTST